MGGKSSKGGAKSPATSPKAGTPVKLKLPTQRVKKESPYDLTYFVFLGGKVIDEFIEVEREVTSPKKVDDFKPPKPVEEMTPEERKAWDAEVEKHEKKLAMAKLMEKNLQKKLVHGDKPIEPPVKGGLLGKAKKKVQQTQEKLAAKAEEATKPTESVEERVKRQALAGAGGSLTGGATAKLGEDIAKSQAIKDLDKKRKEYAKQEEEKKKKEEAERKKKEEEKKKQKPKGLTDFLNEVEGQKPSDGGSVAASAPTRKSAGHKLKAFLQNVEGPAYNEPSQASVASEVEDTNDAVPTSPAAEEPKSNKLGAFLSSVEPVSAPAPSVAVTSEERPKSERKLDGFVGVESEPAQSPTLPAVEGGGSERPKSEGKFSGFLGATVRRLTFKPAEPGEKVVLPGDEVLLDAVSEDQENVAGEPTADRPQSQSKFAGFLGADVRRLTFKPAEPGERIILPGDEQVLEAVGEDQEIKGETAESVPVAETPAE